MKPIAVNLIKAGIIICAFITSPSYAQKTDNIQEGSVWASAVRVDGKLSDWTGPLKATNKDTHLSYTMANDATNLYLVIQSSEPANNSKIMMGGISVTINPDGKKRIKDGFTVTFPVVNRTANRGGQGGGRGQGAQGAQSVTVSRPQGAQTRGGQQAVQMTQKQRDSMQTVQVRNQLAAVKEIKVHGFKNITDSIISIYNEYNVQASAAVDEKGVFIYELAIPLESLEMSADRPKEFSYNIQINGLQFGGGGGGFGGGGNFGGNIRVVNASPGMEDRMAMMSPTEFWGKYTLTKK